MGDLSYTAFAGVNILANGKLEDIALTVKRHLKKYSNERILIFSDSTGKEMDLNLSGTEAAVLERLKMFRTTETPEPLTNGPGRPKLGVVAREISLLPRHWEWLETQAGGASAALRRLIDDARKNPSAKEIVQKSQERVYRFMTTMAGDLPNYEDALRSLYSKDKKNFQKLIYSWPADIRYHILKLADPIWEQK
jgi:hypothetical protein